VGDNSRCGESEEFGTHAEETGRISFPNLRKITLACLDLS
jgi:hypothetical protein